MDEKKLAKLYQWLVDSYTNQSLIISHWDVIGLALVSLDRHIENQPELSAHISSIRCLCSESHLIEVTHLEGLAQVINQLAELIGENPIDPSAMRASH